MAALVLLSGGMDSTISFYHALHDNPPVHALAFDYGQRHVQELVQAKKIFDLAGSQGYNTGLFQILHLTCLPKVGSLMNPAIPVHKYHGIQATDITGEDPSFIPYRNLVFLALSAPWAECLHANEIVTGLRGGFSDCSALFEQSVQLACSIASDHKGPKITSYCHKSRTLCLQEARELPGCWKALSHTLTCFEGVFPPCGECLPCKKRAEGFEQLGLLDPLFEQLCSTDTIN